MSNLKALSNVDASLLAPESEAQILQKQIKRSTEERKFMDAKAKVCRLEYELQTYKDRCEPLVWPLFHGTSWGLKNWLQDTAPPTPSSLHLHGNELRHLQPKVRLPATVASQRVDRTPTPSPSSVVDESPTSTPCLGDKTLKPSSSFIPDPSQPRVVNEASASTDRLDDKVFRPV